MDKILDPLYKVRLLHLIESDKNHKKSAVKKYVVLLIILSVGFSAVTIAYLSNLTMQPSALREPEPEPKMPLTKYVIENLRGDVINTWNAWNIVSERSLVVNILPQTQVTQERIDSVKDAILSNQTLLLDDYLLGKGPPGTSSTYYVGWARAMTEASKSSTKFNVPHQFKIISSSGGEGDITIALTNLKDPDGFAGYTKAIVEGHQLLKATITIYGADDLPKKTFGAIARHEFGHAIGLSHSTATEDLMAPVVQTQYPYISECDLDAIVSLYNGYPNTEVVCEK